MVHAILGIRPPAERERRGSDSQDRMDHKTDRRGRGLISGKRSWGLGDGTGARPRSIRRVGETLATLERLGLRTPTRAQADATWSIPRNRSITLPSTVEMLFVEVVPGQAAAKGDRTGGEDGAAAGDVEIDHVGAQEIFDRFIRPVGDVGEMLFRHQDESSRRDPPNSRARARGRAFRALGRARSSSKPAAPPPDRPKSPRISSSTPAKIQPTSGSAALTLRQVVGALELALGGKAHTCQALRRAAVASPKAAIGAVEGVVVFAGLGSPGADAALGATDLNGAGLGSVEGDPPVKAIAAEIGELAAAIAEALQRVQGLLGMVFRVGSRWSAPYSRGSHRSRRHAAPDR